MPQIKSAKKRMRQEVKRATRNRGRKERLKKAVKTFKAEIKTPAPESSAAALRKVVKAIDVAGAKGILHRNAVNRRKSRMAVAANKAAASAE